MTSCMEEIDTKSEAVRKTVSVVLLVCAGLLLLAGKFRAVKVYDAGLREYGLRGFTRIGDAQLVTDATFSGVTRKGAALISTYDRSVAKGKRACPS